MLLVMGGIAALGFFPKWCVQREGVPLGGSLSHLWPGGRGAAIDPRARLGSSGRRAV